MAQHLIIISIVTILLWYYYTKSKEQDDKYIPVMIRQSELLNENNILKQENKKLKTKIKYLENYKNDVSKTFKILDNELVLINDHIKNQSTTLPNIQNPAPNPNINRQDITSLTPNILHSLLTNSNEQIEQVHQRPHSLFNNMFNRFLTGDMNFRPSREDPNNEETEQVEQIQVQTEQVQTEQIETEQMQMQMQTEQDQTEQMQTEQVKENGNTESLQFSVNYLPLNSAYRQYLIRRDDN